LAAAAIMACTQLLLRLQSLCHLKERFA